MKTVFLPHAEPLRILAVDDDAAMLRYIHTLLELDGHRVSTAVSGEEALALLRGGLKPHLMLLDMMMPERDGMVTLAETRRDFPAVKVVMLTGVSDTHQVVAAMKLGAFDYVTKPFRKPDLDAVIAMAQEKPQGPIETVEELTDDLYFLAASDATRKLREQAGRMALVDVPVLLLGESGTGKEVTAHLIHKLSSRAGKPFLKVNCAAVPAELLESELFGYEAGAFTGAVQAKPGKFEQCQKGTFFLDEIGEMPPQLQAKLLHVLQDGTFSRLGGRTQLKCDARVLAATNIDVQSSLQNRQLRADLYYRLSALTLQIPPLRERKEEIPLLLKHFMVRSAERLGRPILPVSPAMLVACHEYSWPGNLRELGNFVKRYLVLGDEESALREIRGLTSAGQSAAVGGLTEGGVAKPFAQDASEAVRLARALEDSRWNRRVAAEQLGLSYRELLQKMKQHGLTSEPDPRVQRTSAGR